MKALTLILFGWTLLGAAMKVPQESLQLLVVPTYDLTSTKAMLYSYERENATAKWTQVFDPIPVQLGRSGLGLGIGLPGFEDSQEYHQKVEGDGKSPAGIFRLSKIFGYSSTTPNPNMPYFQAKEDLHCVDDSSSRLYNQIVPAQKGYNSFETMRRKDNLYKWGIVVEHNPHHIAKQGSCIFIHITNGKPTAGCTTMDQPSLLKIIKWLDRSKRPVLMQYWSDR